MNSLTRAALIGVTFRIGKVYGPTVIGVRIYLAYHERLGCRDSMMRAALANALKRGASGFQTTSTDERPCSRSYYQRRELTWADRERRELDGRIEHDSHRAYFSRRQAS